MRRYYIAAFVLFFAGQLSAQGLFEAFRYGETTLNGTARYMSMAGAFGALGGDPTSILDNPAGLGIYRGSEITFTLNAIPNVSQSNWSRAVRSDDFNFNLNNLSFVFNVPTSGTNAYLCSNFSLQYNRLRNFNRSVQAYGNSSNSMTDYIAGFTNGLYPNEMSYDNISTPYLSVMGYETYLINPHSTDTSQWSSLLQIGEDVTAGYRIEEHGYIDEYNFAYAANIGNYLYYGVSVGMQSLYYSMTSIYGERFDFGGDMQLNNFFSTSGIGWNFGFGLIARPISFLRIGFSIKTPTYYTMNDSYNAKMRSSLDVTNGSSTSYKDYAESSPTVSSNYLYNSPLRLQGSLAFIIGKKGIVSLEYNFVDYKNTMKFRDNRSRDIYLNETFSFENYEIEQFAKQVHGFKVGAEYRITTQFPVRLGFAYYTPSMEENAGKTYLNNTTRTDAAYFVEHETFYIGAGFGYRYNGFGVDLAYQYRCKKQSFSPYQKDATLYDQEIQGYTYGLYGSTSHKASFVSGIKSHYHNIALTLSYKF